MEQPKSNRFSADVFVEVVNAQVLAIQVYGGEVISEKPGNVGASGLAAAPCYFEGGKGRVAAGCMNY